MIYSAGSVNVNSGSDQVVGISTAFDESMVGGQFQISGDTVVYSVVKITDATHMTLSAAYVGTTQSDAAYRVAVDFTIDCNIPQIGTGDMAWVVHITEALRLIDERLKTAADKLTMMDIATSLQDVNGEYILDINSIFVQVN